MNTASAPPRVVPTLTEVLIEPDLGPTFGQEVGRASLMGLPGGAASEDAPPALIVKSESAISGPDDAALDGRINQQVWLDLQRQVDSILAYRVREALTPILLRVSDLLIGEVRTELSATLRDVVARAVAQELAHQRARQEPVDTHMNTPGVER